MRWQRNTCAKGKESGGEVTQRLGLLLALRDSPLSISAPPETRTVRPTRSRGDADETVLCLQPDLPLAKKLCPPSIKACRNVWKQLGAALFHRNWSSNGSASLFPPDCRRCCSSSTGKTDEPVAAPVSLLLRACGQTTSFQVRESRPTQDFRWEISE